MTFSLRKRIYYFNKRLRSFIIHVVWNSRLSKYIYNLEVFVYNKTFLCFFADDTVFPVFHLADEYQVEVLQRKCEDYLLSKCKDNNTPVRGLVNILLCAENYNMKDLFNISFDKVSKIHPNVHDDIKEFGKLSEETRAKFKRLREQALDVKLTGKIFKLT